MRGLSSGVVESLQVRNILRFHSLRNTFDCRVRMSSQEMTTTFDRRMKWWAGVVRGSSFRGERNMYSEKACLSYLIPLLADELRVSHPLGDGSHGDVLCAGWDSNKVFRKQVSGCAALCRCSSLIGNIICFVGSLVLPVRRKYVILM